MKNRFIVLAGLGLALLQAGSAGATGARQNSPLPDYDKRANAPAKAAVAPAQLQAENTLQAALPDVQVSRDRILGTPRMITSRRGFLTGPQADGGAVSKAALAALPATDPYRVVKAFINEHAAVFGHDATVLDSARVKTDSVTSHNGLRTVIWNQVHDGIPVFEGLMVSHVTRNGELVSLSDRFVPDVAAAASVSKLAAPSTITVGQALAAAAAHAGGNADEASLSVEKAAEGADRRQVVKAAGLAGQTWAQLVWLPMNRSSMRLCWQLVFNTRPAGHRYLSLVDAETSEVLVRRNLTFDARPATYNVYTSDSPSPFSPGHPSPLNGQPQTVERTNVTLIALDTNASPQGWIPDNGMTTSGNNVEAILDRDLGFDPDGPLPNGGPARNFVFPLNLNANPRTYASASIVQLFYRANWYHDRLYQLGFTEAFGNFQVSNLDRGGEEGDPVVCLAQAGADVGYSDNAFFQTAPDGIPGYCAMFTWSGPDPDRCGSLDSEIVIHELTHGLSNRLLGGGTGIYELQSRGLGEGWSDFYALALLSEEADNPNGVYATGGYVTYLMAGLDLNYYYGVRRYPFCTDMAINPQTLKDIDPTQADAHAGISTSPVGGGAADEVHNMGEIWCAVLWEVRAGLLEKFGWVQGNEMTLQLVTDGMKLAPENATFLEARDGIIRADQIFTGGSNYDELWIAFAKRGFGYSAQVPPSDTATGVSEAFDLPPDVVVGVPDGEFEIKTTPAPGTLLFGADTVPFHVRVKDGASVTNATVSGQAGTATLSFRNDGTAPDAFPSDNTYSSSLVTPTNENSVAVTFVVTAPDKVNSTNTVTYPLIPVPKNDNFASATKIPAIGTNYFTSNKKATVEKGEPNHAGMASASASLWWNFVPLVNGDVLVDTGGSDFPTIIGVYTNTSLTNLQVVATAVGSSSAGGRQGAYLKFNGKLGVTYRIAIASTDPRYTGTLRLRIASGGQPDLNSPVATITSPPSGIVVTTNRLTISGSAVDVDPNASGVRYINIGVSTTPGFDGLDDPITVYPIASADGPLSTNWFAVVALKAGVNRISVIATDYAGNKSTASKIDVVYRVLDPANDFFANASIITNLSDVVSINTLHATKEVGEPNHAGTIGGASAWWSFTAPSDGVLSLSTTNSSFDTVLAVYTGAKVNSLTPVGENDDATSGSGFSTLHQPVKANTTYYIAVDGYDGLKGLVFLEYAFSSSTVYQLTVGSGPGGTVTPSSMNVQSNSVVVLAAIANANYEFLRWEGDIVSLANPLSVTVTNHMTITAKFGVIPVTDGFETGDFTALSWLNGAKAWSVQTNSVGAGSWAARSGAIGNNETSSLSLTVNVKEGTGSFSYRVSSEKGWDRLIFLVDGNPIQQWSGDLDWNNFGFPITAGTHTFEWRYSKDNLDSAGEDAAFIDNLNLPIASIIDPSVPVRLTISRSGNNWNIDLAGQNGVEYTLEASSNLSNWSNVSSGVAVDGSVRFTDPVNASSSARYYRAKVARQ